MLIKLVVRVLQGVAMLFQLVARVLLCGCYDIPVGCHNVARWLFGYSRSLLRCY